MSDNRAVYDAIYEKGCALDNQDVPLEEWPGKIIRSLSESGFAVVPVNVPFDVLGEAAISGVCDTGNPKHCWDFIVAKTRVTITEDSP